MNDDDGGLNEPIPSHSCNCLNVRVTASEPGSGSNEPNRLENSSEYTTVFVTVDGVFVVSSDREGLCRTPNFSSFFRK